MGKTYGRNSVVMSRAERHHNPQTNKPSRKKGRSTITLETIEVTEETVFTFRPVPITVGIVVAVAAPLPISWKAFICFGLLCGSVDVKKK